MRNILNDSQIAHNKQVIVQLLRSTAREGIENLIDYMENEGFFVSPSSRTRHHNWRGGLAHHSLGVYYRAMEQNCDVPHSSLVIVTICHDLCKTGLYSYRNGRWIYTPKRGHGGRSVSLLKQLNVKLTDDERRAIYWHMGVSDNPSKQDELLAKRSKLCYLVHKSDKLDARSYYYPY